MQFQDNFVVLSAKRMVDPVLKIAIQKGRFDLDDSTQRFAIEYDPNLAFGRSGQDEREPALESSIKSQPGDLPNKTSPANAFQKVDIVGFGVQTVLSHDTIILKLDSDADTFFLMQHLIAQKLPEPLSKHADNLIDYVIRSMPRWYGLNDTTPCDGTASHFVFLVKKTFARNLPTFKSNTYEEDSYGNIVFNIRSVL